MKEAYQTELASVAKAKRELKKEENLISGILSGRSRVQVMEIAVPGINALHKAQENTKRLIAYGKLFPPGKGVMQKIQDQSGQKCQPMMRSRNSRNRQDSNYRKENRWKKI